MAGGKEINLASYPFWKHVVTVSFTSPTHSYTCSGVLISPNQVITAAHCIVDYSAQPKNAHFFKSTGEVSLPIQVVNFRIHELYNPSKKDTGVDDLAVLTLSRSIQSWEPWKPVRIPSYPYKTPLGTNIVFVSSGLRDSSPNPKDFQKLAFAELPVFYTDESGFAAKDVNEKIFPCGGDSGGAAFQTINGNLYLVGIIVGGSTRCDKYNHTLVTELPVYYLWLGL